MTAKAPSFDAGGGLAAPEAHGAVVVSQGGLCRSGSSYHMMDVGHEYFAARLRGLFGELALAALVTSSRDACGQEALFDGVWVLDLQRRFRGGPQTPAGDRSRRFRLHLCTSVRGLASGVVCELLRMPYVTYLRRCEPVRRAPTSRGV